MVDLVGWFSDWLFGWLVGCVTGYVGLIGDWLVV